MQPRRSAGGVSVVRGAAWGLAILLGTVSALAAPYRFATDDAVSYLDIADAYRRGKWGAALNGYWSPLYSWVLALASIVLRPSPATEILVVRSVNVLLLLVALAAFERLLAACGRDARSPLTQPLWLALAYAIFLWSSLEWIGVRTDTPDMTAAACIYMAAALAVTVRPGMSEWSRMTLLGVAAGAAYFAKAAMLPASIMCVAAGAIVSGRAARSVARAGCGLAAVALTAAVFVVPLSHSHHHFTIGDTGPLNYAWHVFPTRRAVPNEHWQGIPAGFGNPVHPTRRVFTDPDVFEFDGPVGGTYPPWTDPSYWNEGLLLRFDMASQERVVAANLSVFAWLLVPSLALFSLTAFMLGGLRDSLLAAARDEWRLWLPAIAGLATYMLGTDLVVVNIATQPSTRFVAPFAAMLLLTMLCALRIPPAASRAAQRVSIGAVSLVVALLIFSTAKVVAASERERPVALRVAERLRASGIRPGDRVVILGRKYDRDHDHEFWARLARVRIVAQVPNDYEALHLPPERWRDVCAVLSATGARIIVYKPRNGVEPAGWFPLEEGYFGYRLYGQAREE